MQAQKCLVAERAIEEKVKLFRQTLKNYHIQHEVLCAKENDRLPIPSTSFGVETTDSEFRDRILHLLPLGCPVWAFAGDKELKENDPLGVLGHVGRCGQGTSLRRIYDKSIPGGRVRAIRYVLAMYNCLSAILRKWTPQ